MTRGFKPSPPKAPVSTRAAIFILLGLLGASLIVRWLPSPAGVILFFVIVLVGIPLMIMLASDLIRLRQDRMLARRVELFPPTADEPDGRIRVKYAPLALEHVTRWRRWSLWFWPMMVLAVGLFAFGTSIPRLLAALILLITLPPEIIRAGNVLGWIVPSVWRQLSPIEQLQLRAYTLILALVNGGIALGIACLIVFLFLADGQPLAWNHFAFALCYGTLIWPFGKSSYRLLRRAVRKMPPDDPEAQRYV